MHKEHQKQKQLEISEGNKALQILRENYGSLHNASISFAITPHPGKTVSFDLPALISSKLATPLAWAIAEIMRSLESENEYTTENVTKWVDQTQMPPQQLAS